jgi:hypothetical protein
VFGKRRGAPLEALGCGLQISPLGEHETVDPVGHAAGREPGKPFERTNALDQLFVPPEVAERFIDPMQSRLGLGRPEQRTGPEQVACLLGDRERRLEVGSDRMGSGLAIRHARANLRTLVPRQRTTHRRIMEPEELGDRFHGVSVMADGETAARIPVIS